MSGQFADKLTAFDLASYEEAAVESVASVHGDGVDTPGGPLTVEEAQRASDVSGIIWDWAKQVMRYHDLLLRCRDLEIDRAPAPTAAVEEIAEQPTKVTALDDSTDPFDVENSSDGENFSSYSSDTSVSDAGESRPERRPLSRRASTAVQAAVNTAMQAAAVDELKAADVAALPPEARETLTEAVVGMLRAEMQSHQAASQHLTHLAVASGAEQNEHAVVEEGVDSIVWSSVHGSVELPDWCMLDLSLLPPDILAHVSAALSAT